MCSALQGVAPCLKPGPFPTVTWFETHTSLSPFFRVWSVFPQGLRGRQERVRTQTTLEPLARFPNQPGNHVAEMH